MPLPLSRFQVLDLTRARSGPTTVRQFADWGADVLMIEAPGEAPDIIGQRAGSDFQNLHRNKRSLTLDLKSDDGRAILFRLAETADVLVENYRPDVKHRLGIDYAAMAKINPRLVYASISGFGEDGPYAGRPGVDQIAQGMAGLMSVTGLPGQGPVRAGIAVTDIGAGLYCALAIMTALLEREVTGRGRWVRTSLLEAGIAMLDFQAARWLVERECPEQAGNDHPTVTPMGLFATKDGWMNLAAPGPMLVRFCQVAGAMPLLSDERFSTFKAQQRNKDALNAEIAAILKTRSTKDWIEALNGAGVPCGPVNRIDEVFADPQVQHLGMAQSVQSTTGAPLNLVSQPIHMDDIAFALRTAAPALGEHTEPVLMALGYDAAAIADLRARKVV